MIFKILRYRAVNKYIVIIINIRRKVDLMVEYWFNLNVFPIKSHKTGNAHFYDEFW